MPNIIKFFKPNLKLVRGTRLTSVLFIGASMALAAGILWAANMYYDIDTSTVMVAEKQQVTGLLTATTTQITGQSGSPALTVTQTGTGYAAIITGGKVGIATSTPRYAFDVWGDLGVGTSTDTNTPALYVDSGTGGRIGIGTTTLLGLLTVGTSTPSLVVAPTGYVGIATSTPSARLAVTGEVMIDGDLTFVGNQTIQGSGTLKINPTGNLYLQSDYVYIDDSGNLSVIGYASSTRVISPRLEYSGSITINASSSANTTVTVTNEADGTGVADLSVEGDITVTGGKVTLATGETIDAETSNTIIITADATEVLRAVKGGVTITGNATITDVFYAQAGAKITGNVILQGDLLPQAQGAGYTLGDSSTYWDNLYVATTTIGSTGSQLVIDVDDIRAPGGLTITAQNGKIILATGTDVVLAGTGLFSVGSTGQFYIDASGNVTTTGSIYAASFKSASGDATIRKSGEQIVRGVAPIFGFDLPARCKTTCAPGTYATITRVVENDDDIFPAPYPGTTRKYQFAIRYADATTTATTKTTWQVATSSDATYVSQFTLPPTDSTDLAKGFATTTSAVTLPTTNDWFLRVTTGGSGNYELQVYDIMLIGLDEVN